MALELLQYFLAQLLTPCHVIARFHSKPCIRLSIVFLNLQAGPPGISLACFLGRGGFLDLDGSIIDQP